MDNIDITQKKTFKEKKDDCIKQLFQDGGMLENSLSELSDEMRSSFMINLLEIKEVQLAVTIFFGVISRNTNAIKNSTLVSVKTEILNNNAKARSTQSKVHTSSGNIMIDENLIKKVNFGGNDSAQPKSGPSASSPQTVTSPVWIVPVEEKQIMAPSQPDSSAPLPSNLLSPGEIPPVSTPLAKPPTPNLEQSRTTFSVSANGKANIDFIGKIEGKSASGIPVVIVAVTTPPELGLYFNGKTSELCGIPLFPGEFKLNIHFQFEKYESNNPTLNGECNLIINPDPKTLWKDLPSNELEPYWKKDSDFATITGKDGLGIVVASKRGRSHAHIGSCRDDDFCLMQDEDSGWRVITVADGAGSAKMSRKGSLIASRIATDSVLKSLSNERGRSLDEAIKLRETDPATAQKLIQDELYYLFGNAANESVNAIEIEAKAAGVAYKDFSTTLIVTIHKKVTAGHFVAAYWVGDGGVGIYRKGQEVRVLGKADSGEFAGQTRFLDKAMLVPQEIVNRIDAKIVSDFTSIIAMTDGVTDAWFETDANIENIAKWNELWIDLAPSLANNSPAVGLLEWLDFWSPGNHDDRTIAILYPSKPAVQVTSEAVE